MTQSLRVDDGVTNPGSTARDDHDIFRIAPSMDAAVLEISATRLEFRGTDEGYTRRSQAYFARLPLAQVRRILALGCGTGIEVRALRRLNRLEVAIVCLQIHATYPRRVETTAPSAHPGRPHHSP